MSNVNSKNTIDKMNTTRENDFIIFIYSKNFITRTIRKCDHYNDVGLLCIFQIDILKTKMERK